MSDEDVEKLAAAVVANRQLVGVRGEEVVILLPKRVMSKREALVHAAWLVAIADDDRAFAKILEEVRNS